MSALLRDYLPAIGDSWDESFEQMLISPAETHRIAILRELVRTDTLIRPVRLDSEESCVADGMHRILAHHLEGKSDIAVEIDAETYGVPYPDLIDVEFATDYEDFDEAMSALCSFPIGGDWAQSDIASGMEGRYHFCFYWDRSRMDELAAALLKQAAMFRIKIQNLQVSFDPDQDD